MQIADSSELWKPIPDYPKYWISTWGRVKNIRFNRILTPKAATNGYLQVTVANHNHKKSKCIHQLMAKTFLGPKLYKHEISHIDENQENNKLSNLEYVFWRLNRRISKKPPIKCQICGGVIIENGKICRNVKRQTCSPECNFLNHNTLVKCETCGLRFYRKNRHINIHLNQPRYNGNKHYCNRSCFANRPDHVWKKKDLPLLTQILRAKQ